MKFSKRKFTVTSSKEFRAQRLEGEGEGKLGKEVRIEGTHAIGTLKGLFTSAEAYQADIAAAYNEQGALVSNRGKWDLGNEGRACKLEILFGLTETNEFEDCTIDSIKIKLEEGKVATVKARLKLFPDNKQLSRIPHWVKNEITLTLNGETISAEDKDDDEDADQAEMTLAPPDDEDDDSPPAAGPGEVLPGVPAEEQAEVPPAHRDSVKDLQEAGVIGVRGKPSTAHGEVAVPGQRPPQRPRRRETLQ